MMTVILYDGSAVTCDVIEISVDHQKLIVDEYRTIPLCDILRIVPGHIGERRNCG